MLLAVRDDDEIDFLGLGESIELFENLVGRHPDPLPEYYLGLGDAYFSMSASDSKLRDKAKQSWRRYLQLAGAGGSARRRVEEQLRSL